MISFYSSDKFHFKLIDTFTIPFVSSISIFIILCYPLHNSTYGIIMEFYSLQFLIFLILSLLFYYFAPKKFSWCILLAVSMIFYSFFGIKNFLFIFLVAALTFSGAILLQKFSDSYSLKKTTCSSKEEKKKIKDEYIKRKRIILAVFLILIFSILAVLKYLEPILKGILSFTEKNKADFHILLPLGISFYTFQSVGYLIDIYNEKYQPERNFFKFLLFISWFPQIIQGPINRFNSLAPQFYERKPITSEAFGRALSLFLLGLFKKYAIANMLVDSIAQIFDTPDLTLTGSVSAFGILMYSAQQYADFSGGIDMVLAVSQLFGINMMQNFRQPYFSINLGDFWRRWHISLGAWMRDYVFYPFALLKGMQNFGKWCSKHLGKHFGRVIPAGIANILVFLIVGIWHGAEIHYLLWGLYNGIIIALSDILSPVFSKTATILHINVKTKAFHVFRIIRTFIIVNIGWYFDRIYNVKHCFSCLKNLFCNFSLSTFQTDITNIIGRFSEGMYIAAFSCVLLFIYSLLKENNIDVYSTLKRAPFIIRWGIYVFVIIIFLISFMSVTVQQGFLYANF